MVIQQGYNEIWAQGVFSRGKPGFNLAQVDGGNYSEFEVVTLPEEFEYFGQSFSHVYVNENGFLTLEMEPKIQIYHGKMLY